MSRNLAAAYARSAVERVRDDPTARLALLRQLYEVPRAVDHGYLPYRRAASAFMGWQLRRGLLNPQSDPRPGSPWWRALNEGLLHDTAEARAFAFGYAGEPSGPGVTAHLEFILAPTARNWYRPRCQHRRRLSGEPGSRYRRAAGGAVLHERCSRPCVVRARLVAAPRLALCWLVPLGRPAGDPRSVMTGIFMSLSRVLPDRCPLGDDVDTYVAAEHGFGHLLDIGVIQPRLHRLSDWSSSELALPGLL